MIENIEVFTQNSIRIRSGAGTIYIDPFRITEAWHDADFILVTHDHYDHYSPEDIEKVAGDSTILVVTERMGRTAKEVSGLVKEIRTVSPGGYYDINGLEFDTIPAYNVMKPFHPKGAGCVGYLLRVDGKRIYIAGDTDATKEAKDVHCDIALVPIGGTYTMDAKKAAELINEIRPEIAIPTHYGNIVGKPSDADTFAKLVNAPVKVERKIQF